MADKNSSWHSLPLYQRIKYVFELVAICGGILLLAVNAYQVRLLFESNKISQNMLSLTFPPPEIEISLLEFKDNKPLNMRFKVTNLTNRSVEFHTLLPQIVAFGSKELKTDLSLIRIGLSKEGRSPSESFLFNGLDKITLKSGEGCLMEVSADLSVTNSLTNRGLSPSRPLQTAFIAIPVTIHSLGQTSKRTILISLARDKNGSLTIASIEFPVFDNGTLLQVVRYARSILSVPVPDSNH